MTNLYELTGDMVLFEGILEEAVNPETGELEISDEILAAHIRVTGETNEKLDGYIRFIENLDADAKIREADYKVYKEMIEKHRVAAKSSRSKIDRLKAYIKSCMDENGLKEINTDHFTLKIVNNGGNPAVKVPDKPDFKLWPDDLYAVILEPDKDAIRKAAAENRKLPEGVEVYRGTNLRIK